jgi:branched-chain amino acid transport system substrate-binding protein
MLRFLIHPRSFRFGALAGLLLLVLSACNREEAPTAPKSQQDASVPHQSETVAIGVIQPLTGPIAVGGQRALHGIELAIEEHNAKAKPTVELHIEDSQGAPAEGVKAINKLVSVDRVRFILGDLTSGVTMAIAPIAQRHKTIILATGASSPNIRDAGDYIFRNWVSDDFDGKVAAEYLHNELNKKRVVLLKIQNEYGASLAAAFEARLTKLGGTIVFEEAFPVGHSDFRTLITKVKSVNFDAIYLAGQPKESGYLLRQMKELGVRALVFSNTSVEEADFKAIAADAAEGLYYTTPSFDLASGRPLIQNFVRAYQQKFNEEPDVVSAHGYDAARMLLACLVSAPRDVESVKGRLYRLSEFEGVTGTCSFDSHGDVVKGLLVKRLDKDGAASVVQYYSPSTD